MGDLQSSIKRYEAERDKSFEILMVDLVDSNVTPPFTVFIRDWIEFECLMAIAAYSNTAYEDDRNKMFDNMWSRLNNSMIGPGAGLAVDRYVLMKAWLGNSGLYQDVISKGLPKFFGKKVRNPKLIISICENMATELRKTGYNKLAPFVLGNTYVQLEECSGVSQKDMDYLLNLYHQYS